MQLHHLHAKVYVADESVAIITSGNLTKSGLDRNYEYGVRLSDPTLVRRVREDFREVERFASPVLISSLERWSGVAAQLRPLQAKAERTASRQILREFRRRIEEVEREVQRIRAQGQTDNSIFAKAIVHFLERRGPLTTAELHPLIQSVYPDLCDDRIDRVIDGVHFGKRWKHMVRNAQQYLKRKGEIRFDGRRWSRT